eukprot:NODE_667_length_4902_cov_0.676660.p5 type:complete len:116 gc:universal NODE_667_length_4902_cov_0.676660:3593-3940(+)
MEDIMDQLYYYAADWKRLPTLDQIRVILEGNEVAHIVKRNPENSDNPDDPDNLESGMSAADEQSNQLNLCGKICKWVSTVHQRHMNAHDELEIFLRRILSDPFLIVIMAIGVGVI